MAFSSHFLSTQFSMKLLQRFYISLSNTSRCCSSLVKSTPPVNILSLKENERAFADIFPQKSEKYIDLLLSSVPPGVPLPSVYCGFDPSADSLQLGNLFALTALLKCRMVGHNVVALLGGATGMLGDPTGLRKDRPDQVFSEVTQRCDHLQRQLEHIFRRQDKLHESANQRENYLSPTMRPIGSVQVCNNISWAGDSQLSALEFLTQVAKHIRLKDIIHKESMKRRISCPEGINMREFCYPIFQAYDWLHLYKEYGCVFQLGGNDQQGNIDVGITLLKKALGTSVFGVTVPLYTIGGKKVGKTTGGGAHGTSLWLNKDKTPSFILYQHLLNTSDVNVEFLLLHLTLLRYDAVQDIMGRHQLTPERRYAQKILAAEVVSLIHDDDAVEACDRCSVFFYSHEKDNSELSTAKAQELLRDSTYLPTLHVTWDDQITPHSLLSRAMPLATEIELDDLIVQRRDAGLCISGRVVELHEPLTRQELFPNEEYGVGWISWGRSQHWLVVETQEASSKEDVRCCDS